VDLERKIEGQERKSVEVSGAGTRCLPRKKKGSKVRKREGGRNVNNRFRKGSLQYVTARETGRRTRGDRMRRSVATLKFRRNDIRRNRKGSLRRKRTEAEIKDNKKNPGGKEEYLQIISR